MAVTTNSIITPQTPWSGSAVCSLANTDFDTPTNLQVLLDEAENLNGVRIDALWAVNRGAMAAVNNFQIYSYDGPVTHLIDSKVAAPNSPSATVASNKTVFDYSDDGPLVLKAGVGLKVAIGSAIADGVVFRAQGGLY